MQFSTLKCYDVLSMERIDGDTMRHSTIHEDLIFRKYLNELGMNLD